MTEFNWWKSILYYGGNALNSIFILVLSMEKITMKESELLLKQKLTYAGSRETQIKVPCNYHGFRGSFTRTKIQVWIVVMAPTSWMKCAWFFCKPVVVVIVPIDKSHPICCCLTIAFILAMMTIKSPDIELRQLQLEELCLTTWCSEAYKHLLR